MRLMAPLNIYFTLIKKINSIVNCEVTTDKSKIVLLKMLLIGAEEDIKTAELEVLNQHFNMTEDDVLEAYVKVQAGPVKCHLFLN
jgi:hypothetical protein